MWIIGSTIYYILFQKSSIEKRINGKRGWNYSQILIFELSKTSNQEKATISTKIEQNLAVKSDQQRLEYVSISKLENIGIDLKMRLSIVVVQHLYYTIQKKRSGSRGIGARSGDYLVVTNERQRPFSVVQPVRSLSQGAGHSQH
ncbi:MAG: hypothetical protein EZS28_029920 [Streblomastix strix]|uniref:Uncharacterized protein n=1 Tax=Streblomastix strix TaxID=222440 RepID=A0A5J4UW64_9EUKA|nr:MAG: hypothetical protein EZS28_029920 [Streblomastix strix]